jgi:hypothetical protein
MKLKGRRYKVENQSLDVWEKSSKREEEHSRKLIGDGSLERTEIFGEIWWLDSPQRGNVQARR